MLKIWLFIAISSLVLLGYAHFLQVYLFMKPCEQCVYLRFAFFVIAFSGLLGILSVNFLQKFSILRNLTQILAYILGFWGVFLGVKHALALDKLHSALKNADPFGVSGCSQTPHFPFGLPLHSWFGALFEPNGVCGLDTPFVPAEKATDLSALQALFVGTSEQNFTDGLYSEGWYLVPQAEFLSMAQGCLLVFLVFGVVLLASFLLWGKGHLKPATLALCGAFALIIWA